MLKIFKVLICLLVTTQYASAQPPEKIKVEIDTAFSCPYSKAFITVRLRITNTRNTPIYVLRRDVEQTLGVSFYSGGSGIVVTNTDFRPTDEYGKSFVADSTREKVSAYYDTLLKQNDKYLADSFDRHEYFRIAPNLPVTIYARHDIDLDGYSFKPITPLQKKNMQTQLSQNMQYYGQDKITMDVVQFKTPASLYLKQAFLNYFKQAGIPH